ncbi:MAG: hypothetical protein HOV81_23360 [Kofleriaceae bacterium]|nr:hypothetical protein [Kofleriaceae bacterium]
MKRAALLVVLGACAADTGVQLTPIIDVPTNDTASAFPIDSYTVVIAHDGQPDDLVSATFQAGEPMQIDNIPFGDDLVIHMFGRVGTSEVAYGRTCKFAVRADGRVPAPHLWFSRLVKFGSLEARPIAREGGTALTFDDGSGLLLGGHVPGDPRDSIDQVERFDPAAGAYETLHDVSPRSGAVSAILGTEDARVAVIGGKDETTNQGAGFVEVIDADRTTNRQYEKFDDSQMDRIGLSATTLTDGRVIAIGGETPIAGETSGTISDKVTEVALEDGGTVVVRELRAKLSYPLVSACTPSPTHKCVAGRKNHTATRLADDVGSPVLVAGGLDANDEPIPDAELFKPLAESFSPNFNAKMVVPRSNHRAVRLPDGSVLILGGVDAAGQPVDTIEQFSLDSGFTKFTDPNGGDKKLPANAGLIDFTATTLPDGRVLITGGRRIDGGDPLNTAYIARLDPFNGTVDIVATDRLQYPRAGHQATLLCDGTVLLSGGDARLPDGSSGQTPYERYNPPSLGRR